MVFDERAQMIEQRIKELSYQPLSEMRLGIVDYVPPELRSQKEETEPQEEHAGERLQGHFLQCEECGKQFHVEYGCLKSYLWKFSKQKNHVKKMLYFCTYTHMKVYQREHSKKNEKGISE